MMIPLEVPVFSPPSAAAALLAGAHRLELNRAGSYPQGGLTPSLADLEAFAHARDARDARAPEEDAHAAAQPTTTTTTMTMAPLRVMIRPRGPLADGGADFVYSDAELGEMREAVRAFAGSGLMRRERGDGFVFGVVRNREGGAGRQVVVVDVERNRELVGLAEGWPCVFHRAFDDILGSGGSTPEQALADLGTCGFRGLLTSGGPGSAAANADTLRAILRAAPRVGLAEIIVGGGVRSANVARLRAEVLPAAETAPGAVPRLEVWFHSSCLTSVGETDVVDEVELKAIVEGLSAGGSNI